MAGPEFLCATAMYPDLYLMRHGQTEWNAAGRMQGRLDSALTPLGVTQAQRQAKLVRGLDAQRISSSQGRARQTARIVFGERPFVSDDRLVEIHIGDFTGMTFDELRRAQPSLFAGDRLSWYDHAPSGEGFAGLMMRSREFLDSLDRPALVVTHGVTLRTLRLLALGWPLSRLEDLTVEQGAVHVIRNASHEVWR